MDSVKEPDFIKTSQILTGVPASEGIGIGPANIYHTSIDDIPDYQLDINSIPAELERYYSAVNEVGLVFQNLQNRMAREIGSKHSQIYETYHLILDDPLFQEEIPEAIRKLSRNSASVIKKKLTIFEKQFLQVNDEYLRERIFDVRGVSRRLIFHLLQKEIPAEFLKKTSSIIFSQELAPADSVHFHHKAIKGIVTEFGGKTSHTAILARSLEVPAVVGVKHLLRKVRSGDFAIVDGINGKIILRPDKELLDYYHEKQKKYIDRKKKLFKTLSQPITHFKGRGIKLLANLNEVSEIDLAKKYKVDGIGLFRTEFEFIARESLLTEDEQFMSYRKLLMAFPKQDVTIRLLDLGGDKFLPFADSHKEANPFLGWRSIRILFSELDVLKAQLRAIYRASIYGNVKLLIPMVSCRDEILAMKEMCLTVQNELAEENESFNPDIPFGIMVEIPSAAIMIDFLIEEVDFLSIGTNDLIQYTLAVDRNNEKVAEYYQPLNTAVLRLIARVAQIAKENGKPVSVCGEMAGNPLFTELLLSFGIDQLSMPPAALPEIKRIILKSKPGRLEQIREEILSLKKISERQEYLQNLQNETL